MILHTPVFKKKSGGGYGPEMVTNGTFDTDTDWAKGAGWTISGGEAVGDSNFSPLSQQLSLIASKEYEIQFVVTLEGRIGIFDYVGASRYVTYTVYPVGTHSEVFTANSNSGIRIYKTSTISLDSVSVKELL